MPGRSRLSGGRSQSLKMPPSGVGLIVSTVSGLRWRNFGSMTCETIIASTPVARNATALTNGGPMPNQELPDSELAGSHSSISDLTKM